MRTEVTGERRDSIRHLVLEPDGSWNGRAWSEPGTEVYFMYDDNGWGSMPVIFGRSTMAATAGASLALGADVEGNLWVAQYTPPDRLHPPLRRSPQR